MVKEDTEIYPSKDYAEFKSAIGSNGRLFEAGLIGNKFSAEHGEYRVSFDVNYTRETRVQGGADGKKEQEFFLIQDWDNSPIRGVLKSIHRSGLMELGFFDEVIDWSLGEGSDLAIKSKKFLKRQGERLQTFDNYEIAQDVSASYTEEISRRDIVFLLDTCSQLVNFLSPSNFVEHSDEIKGLYIENQKLVEALIGNNLNVELPTKEARSLNGPPSLNNASSLSGAPSLDGSPSLSDGPNLQDAPSLSGIKKEVNRQKSFYQSDVDIPSNPNGDNLDDISQRMGDMMAELESPKLDWEGVYSQEKFKKERAELLKKIDANTLNEGVFSEFEISGHECSVDINAEFKWAVAADNSVQMEFTEEAWNESDLKQLFEHFYSSKLRPVAENMYIDTLLEGAVEAGGEYAEYAQAIIKDRKALMDGELTSEMAGGAIRIDAEKVDNLVNLVKFVYESDKLLPENGDKFIADDEDVELSTGKVILEQGFFDNITNLSGFSHRSPIERMEFDSGLQNADLAPDEKEPIFKDLNLREPLRYGNKSADLARAQTEEGQQKILQGLIDEIGLEDGRDIERIKVAEAYRDPEPTLKKSLLRSFTAGHGSKLTFDVGIKHTSHEYEGSVGLKVSKEDWLPSGLNELSDLLYNARGQEMDYLGALMVQAVKKDESYMPIVDGIMSDLKSYRAEEWPVQLKEGSLFIDDSKIDGLIYLIGILENNHGFDLDGGDSISQGVDTVKDKETLARFSKLEAFVDRVMDYAGVSIVKKAKASEDGAGFYGDIAVEENDRSGLYAGDNNKINPDPEAPIPNFDVGERKDLIVASFSGRGGVFNDKENYDHAKITCPHVELKGGKKLIPTGSWQNSDLKRLYIALFNNDEPLSKLIDNVVDSMKDLDELGLKYLLKERDNFLANGHPGQKFEEGFVVSDEVVKSVIMLASNVIYPEKSLSGEEAREFFDRRGRPNEISKDLIGDIRESLGLKRDKGRSWDVMSTLLGKAMPRSKMPERVWLKDAENIEPQL